MIENLHQGTLAEIKTIEWFARRDFWIYKSMFGWEPCDIIVEKEGVLKRVSVKSTTQRNISDTSWRCGIKQVRVNKTTNTILNFDREYYDYLSIYIVPLDKVLIYDSKKLTVTTQVTIPDKDIIALEAFNG